MYHLWVILLKPISVSYLQTEISDILAFNSPTKANPEISTWKQ